jgi:hypothetical protein
LGVDVHLVSASGFLRLLHAAAPHIRVDVETIKEDHGAFNMTKTFAAVQNPRADQPSQPPINSIMATVTTARDLDIAHRKAAKAKGSRHSSNRSPNAEFRPILSAKQRDESLIQFVLRVGGLVAAQIRARGRK